VSRSARASAATTCAEDVEEALDANAPGTVEFTGYASAAAAQDAVKHQQVYGAYVIAEDGRSAQLLYAGANGPSVTSTLEAIFHAVAQRSGTTMQSKDVLSVSPGDTRSLSIFYTGFGLVLGGYLFGLVSSQMAPRMRLRRRLVSLVAFSVLGGRCRVSTPRAAVVY
jgi:hypothetical protein